MERAQIFTQIFTSLLDELGFHVPDPDMAARESL